MIPEMIVRRLPEGLDLEQVSEFVQLGSAPDGKLGETLLLRRPGGLLVYVCESFTDDFAPIPLVPNTVPTLEQGQWAQTLLLESVEGPRTVEISSFDLDKVNALLANLGAEPPAQDLAEQVPAGAREAPRVEAGEAPRVEAGEAQDQPEAGSAEPAELRSRLGRCLEANRRDEAWCLAAALTFLDQANADERALYEQHHSRDFVRAQARMYDELWRRHFSLPQQDRLVGQILAIGAPVIGPLTARPHKMFGLKRKERRDLATDQLLFSKVFCYVTNVLNVVPAELYLRPNQQTGLMMAHTRELPSFVVGAELLQGRPEKELAFAVGKQLSYLRPEYFLRQVLTAPSQLRAVFFAIARLGQRDYPAPASEQDEINKLLTLLAGQLHPGQLDQVAVLVRELADSGAEVDIDRWWAATELMANRAGFVLSSDLQVAARMITEGPREIGSRPAEEQVEELLLFATSGSYFEVRRQLGMTVDGAPPQGPAVREAPAPLFAAPSPSSSSSSSSSSAAVVAIIGAVVVTGVVAGFLAC
jgi:hypothetical protein